MFKRNALKRKKICIVAVWLIGVLISIVLLYLLEKSLCSDNGKADLLEQADVVAEQIPAIIENDFYSQAGFLKLQFDKVKALSFALTFYEDAEQAKPFLDDFVQNADVDALAMFDRNGNMLYCSDADFKTETDVITSESFERMRKENIFEKYAQSLTYSDDILQSAFTYDPSDTEDYPVGWFVQDRYLLVMKGNKSDAMYKIEEYFSWPNVLRRIRIGSNGCLFAIDENSGKILSFGASDASGDSMESLDIVSDDGKKMTDPEDLLSLFDAPEKVVGLKVAGRNCYAARVSVKNVLMLALLPTDEIISSALNATVPLAALMCFITGLVMVYIFLHVGANKEQTDRKDRGGLHALKGKLWICIILAILALLVLSFYLQALILHSNSFGYCRGRLNSMINLLESNSEALETLETLSDEEYLTRCRGAKSILDYAEKANVDRDYLNSLCGAMSLRYIFLFDENGTVTLTNSPYDRWSLDKESPFFDLLKGEPWICGELEKDEKTGEYRQLMGASLKDAEDRTCGAVLFSMDPVERRTITDNLGMKSVFEQICLRDNTLVMTVDSGDFTIAFQAEVEGGTYKKILGSDDNKKLSVSILGIDEKQIRDNYNGDMRINKKNHFVSICFWNDDYYMVLYPQSRFNGSYIYPISLTAAASLILLLILCALTYLFPESGDTQAETADRTEASQETEAPQTKHQWAKRFRNVNESFFKSLMDQKNAFFEERWPKDGIRWKDKTISQKFDVCFIVVLIMVFIVSFVHILLAGEKSIWYYCLIGDWVKGINIFSLTTCVIGIYVLVIIRVLGHRLLYLTARVVDARGETICHLLDSTQGYVLFIIGVFFCLSSVGVSLMALSLTGGVAGVIFGIGCQNIVADILAGIIMVFEGVVYAGDFVSYNGKFGAVLSIGVRTTKIKYYGEVVIVRNNDFKNFVLMGAEVRSRITVDLWVDLREKLERIESIIEKEKQWVHDETRDFSWDDGLEGPEYRGVKQIGENGYALNFAIYVQGKNYGWALRGLNRSLKMMCERNNIRLSMPQIVVNEPVQMDNELSGESCQIEK